MILIKKAFSMKKKIKLTKEQKQMIDEITVTADTGATNGNIAQAVQNAQNNAKRSGIRNASVLIPANEGKNEETVVSEMRLTKEDVKNIRRQILRENSITYKKSQLNEMFKK